MRGRYWSASSRIIRSWAARSLSRHFLAFLEDFSFSGSARKLQPCIRFLSTATTVRGNLRFICNGSSPKALAGPSAVTCWNPFVFLLYPRERTAIFFPAHCGSEARRRSSISVCGVFPVPPTVTFPIEMVGTGAFLLFLIPLSYRKCLNFSAM